MKGKDYYLIVRNKKISVTKDVYLMFHRMLNAEKYQNRKYEKNKVIFCNIAIYCDEQSVIEIVDWNLLKERLTEALMNLTDSEYDLIAKLFFEGVSERELAKEYQTSQSSINRMKHTIFMKLKHYILSEE